MSTIPDWEDEDLPDGADPKTAPVVVWHRPSRPETEEINVDRLVWHGPSASIGFLSAAAYCGEIGWHWVFLLTPVVLLWPLWRAAFGAFWRWMAHA